MKDNMKINKYKEVLKKKVSHFETENKKQITSNKSLLKDEIKQVQSFFSQISFK